MLFPFGGFSGADDHVIREVGSLVVVALEEEVRLELLIQLERGVEWFVEAGLEALERADDALVNQCLQFILGERATGDVFLDFDRQLRVAGFVGRIGLPEDKGAVNRVLDFDIVKLLVLRLLREAVRLGDDLVGVVDDFLHELRALKFPVFHLAELVFPVAGEFGRIEPFDVHLDNELDEATAGGGDVEITSVAE